MDCSFTPWVLFASCRLPCSQSIPHQDKPLLGHIPRQLSFHNECSSAPICHGLGTVGIPTQGHSKRTRLDSDVPQNAEVRITWKPYRLRLSTQTCGNVTPADALQHVDFAQSGRDEKPYPPLPSMHSVGASTSRRGQITFVSAGGVCRRTPTSRGSPCRHFGSPPSAGSLVGSSRFQEALEQKSLNALILQDLRDNTGPTHPRIRIRPVSIQPDRGCQESR